MRDENDGLVRNCILAFFTACYVINVIGFMESPSPSPLCYSNQAYRDTHEDDCIITPVKSNQNAPTGGGRQGGLGGLLHGLTGGLL
jgi:hypothetical protein